MLTKKETIPIQIRYTTNPDGVTILGVSGRASELRIPETIEGMPVTAVGKRAFAVKEEFPPAEEELPAELSYITTGDFAPVETGQAVKRIYLPDTVKTIGDDAFSGCTELVYLHLPEALEVLPDHMLNNCGALTTLALPPHLKTIKGYAFYNCRSLKELSLPEGIVSIGHYAFYNCRSLGKLSLPSSAVDLGTGLFLNCDDLHDISFGRCKDIANLISVLNHELHLTIDFEQESNGVKRARLVVPDFQYEYIEDTPARQFHQINYGTGHIFRQCIGNNEIDFRRYDEIFYLTRREDAAVTVLLLAVNRLEYPYRLEEKRLVTYLDYLREHFLWAAEYFLDQNDEHRIRLFTEWGLVTRDTLPDLLRLAQEKRRTSILSFLMDYQHKTFGTVKKKKTFEL